MQLGRIHLENGDIRIGLVEDSYVRLLKRSPATETLSAILHADDPRQVILAHKDDVGPRLPLSKLVAPIDQQEVWAAGVTYIRSREARERESEGAARFYDLVYRAQRPELFFKAPAYRVRGPGQPVHIRRDATWSVPEPELALVISPALKLVGFTIGNDMSSRDIEGENPLYLPQAKFYDGSCSLGPVITLPDAMPHSAQITIDLRIERGGKEVFHGATSIAKMARSFEDLISWLGKETSFPNGVILLTGTGVVPPDDFTLAIGDLVHIDVAGIGRLSNPVTQRT